MGQTSRLWRRWRRKLPSSIGPEDLQQAMMLLAVDYVKKCDPERVTRRGSYGGYIVWCSVRRTTRQIHRWRGAKLSGKESANPGNYERCFASLTRADADRRDDFESRLVAENADPLEVIARSELIAEHVANSATVREALAILALAKTDGSIEAAGDALYACFETRIELGARDPEHARRMVREAVAGMAPTPAAAPVEPPADLFDPVVEPEELWERALRTRAALVDVFQPIAAGVAA